VIGRNPAGELQCLVEGSATLKLSWQQAAADTTAGVDWFDLRLPIAPRRRLEIMAPKDIELTIEGGLILDYEIRAMNAHERVWPIELTSAAKIRLFARHANAIGKTDRMVIVREETIYSVLPAVLDLETTFTLDVLRKPLQELKFDVGAGLQITRVRIADQNLPFAAAAAENDVPQVVTVNLPSELSGTDRIVQIEATARWSGEQSIELPRIKVADGLLQDGRLEVHAPSWLRLQARPLRGCVQSDAAPATATRATDRFVFQAFAADGGIEVAPNHSLAPLREESGTQLNVEATQITGVLMADLRATGSGARFAITAEVPHQWIVDAVETQPADMLADRTLISRGQNPHQLQIKLARPFTAQQPLRFIIRGHFRRPPNDQPLGDEFFHMARFPEVHDRRQLVAVRVNDPAAELRLSGSEGVPRLDPAELTPAELRLFENSPDALVLETGSLGQTLQASLIATTARYRADTIVRAQIARGRIEETATIHCQPETSTVASIVVRVAPRPHGEVTWRLAGDEMREIPALLEDSPAMTVGAEDAVYRLLLPRPYSSPFDVVGQWSSHQSATNALSLVFVPSAIRQTGLIEITAESGDVFVRAEELQAIPSPQGNQQYAPLYARFRYEAGRRSKVLVEPIPSGVVQAHTYIDSLRLTSHFLPDGSAEHEAQLKIQNAGSTQMQMRLSRSASDCRLVTDSEAEEPLDQLGADNLVSLPLPPDQRDVFVRVRYISKEPALGIWPTGAVRAPVPCFDLPVLEQTWRVLLPLSLATVTRPAEFPRLATPNADQHQESPAAPTDSIGDRIRSIGRALLGPALVTHFLTVAQQHDLARDPSFSGWSEHVLLLPASAEATLLVYRPTIIAAWSYCLALAAGAMIFWVRGRSGWWLFISGLLAATAVMSQAPIQWLLGGASAGILVGQLLLLARPAAKSRTFVPPYQASTTTKHYAIEPAAGTVAFLIVTFAARLIAAPPDENSNARRDPPRVVIPVDNDQRPTGEYVFVEGSLYEKLHHIAEAERSGHPVVLFERARYELPTAPSARGTSAAVDELRATFDLHTLHSNAVVQLPLRRDQVHLLEGRARLDGQPTILNWKSDGRAIALTVVQSGKHHLEIALAAAAQLSHDSVALDIDVPRSAIAEPTLPSSGISAGTVVSSGANGKLQFHWPVADASANGTTALEADQLLWWKVRPGSVSLEGKFRLRALDGPVRELIFEVDPRLRLVPGRTSGPFREVKFENGIVNAMKAELAEPLSAPVELRLTWLWPDTSGVGSLVLPRVKLKADRLLHEWTAISTDAGLEIGPAVESNDAASRKKITPAEFTQVWPDANLGEGQVFAPDEESQAVFVRPLGLPPRAEQRTDWSVSSTLAQAIYTAHLTRLPASRYEHRLAVPAQMNVSRVNLTQAGRAAAVRWKQEKGVLIVSLLEPPAWEQTMTVMADYSQPKDQTNISLPAFSLENVSDGDCSLRIYRQSDVQLRIGSSDQWLPIDQGQLDEYRPGLGRLIAGFQRQTTNSPPPRIIRATNRPQITGKIFTRAREDDGDWRADVHLKLLVSRGVLDELRLSVPDEWSERLEVEPPMVQRLEASQSDGRRQLVLRGRQALTGSVEITMRGTIHASAGGLQAPDVFLVGSPPLERFALLDRGSLAEQIDWEMTGLLALGPSAMADSPPAWRGASGDWFRVVGQRFDAVAKSRPASGPAPRVVLADIRCAARTGRRVVVHAAMTVQPLGAHQAAFVLPAGSRLVQARIDDNPVPCVLQGLRIWKIPAVSETLPYRLTIIYDTTLPSPTVDGAPPQIAAPVLVGMEVQRSLWVLENRRAAPNSVVGHELHFAITDQAETSSLAATELARLDTVVHTLDSIASAQTIELPRRILAEGFRRWKRELMGIQHRLRDLQDQKELGPNMAAQMQSTLDVAIRAEQRLLQAGILSDSDVGETTHAEHNDLHPSATYYLVNGNPGQLNVSWESLPSESTASRGEIAVGIVIAALLVALALQLTTVRDWLTSRPYLALAMLGVVWWAIAPFGWLGWFAVFAALWCAIRSFSTRSSYGPGSSIMRWSASKSG
jgi:hypothetical protein